MDNPSSIVIADTSVIVNFLAVDRMDLIQRHGCRFFITNHVRQEITEHYHDQFTRLQLALEQNILEEIIVTDPEEVKTFVELTRLTRFGTGECACISVAMHRHYTLAIDDKSAIKQAILSCPAIHIITTQDLIIAMIKKGILSVNEADAIKDEWAYSHKFKLKLNSFGDLL